jgi:twitching motility protein PilT
MGDDSSADKTVGPVHVSLVESLLGAIIRLDGDSLVLHTGEKPYVVTSSSAMNAFRGPVAWGQVELSTRLLSSDAVTSMLQQLLTGEQLRVLEELGAVENEIPEREDRPAFRVIAARGGDDIWVEIRPVRPPAEVAEPAPPPPAEATVPPVIETPPSAEPAPFEIVPEVEQEELDEQEVAQLLATSGLGADPGVVLHDDEEYVAHAPGIHEGPDADSREVDLTDTRADLGSEEAPDVVAARAAQQRLAEVLREEEARLERLRQEAERLEAEQLEQAARLAAAREDAEREAAERLAAEQAAEAQRIAAEQQRAAEQREAEARLAAQREEQRAEQEARFAALREAEALIEAQRQELAALAEERRLEEARMTALREEEAARMTALRDEEAARMTALREEEEARLAAVREEETGRMTALREEAARMTALREEEAARLTAVREEEDARLAARREEEEARFAALRQDEGARLAGLRREEEARLGALRQQEEERIADWRREQEARMAAWHEEEEARLAARREEENARRLEEEALAARREELEAALRARREEEERRLAALREEEAARVAAAREEEAARVAALREEEARLAALRERETAALAALREEETARLAALREAEAARVAARLVEEEQRLAALRAEEEQRLAGAREQEKARAAALREEEARIAAQRDELARLAAERDAESARLAALREEETLRIGALRQEAAMAAAHRDELNRLVAERQVEVARLRSLQDDQARLDAARRLEEVRVESERGEQPVATLRPKEDSAPAAQVADPGGARPAHVVPLVRTLRDQPHAPASGGVPDIDRLLRIAAARGASGLYLVTQSVPTLRVDGEIQQLADEEPLGASDVEAFMLALAPEPSRDAVRSGETYEWFCDVADVGGVRCLAFRDHRGPGVIVRMMPARMISAEQLGLSRDIQALTTHGDGLVLVTGPRASGKSALMAAFVDLINRTRADHVITIERQLTFVHESRRAFVSQREVRGEAHEVLASVRAALREDPDVLVVEDLRSPEVVATVLEAAESGRLVIAGYRAPSAGKALERIVAHLPLERRSQALAGLSTSLRAVLAQALLRKRGGGRVAARELLLNTPAAASVIAEGKLFQLAAALESGRKLGSVPLNDALVALIREGTVDAGEAWRRAYDREGLLTLLKREGIDTSFVERLA